MIIIVFYHPRLHYHIYVKLYLVYWGGHGQVEGKSCFTILVFIIIVKLYLVKEGRPNSVVL